MPKTTDPDPLWPPTDPLTAAIQARLFSLSRAIDAEIGRIAADVGLKTGELVILGALKRMGPPHQSTASDLLRLHWVSMPGLMKQLDKLEELGFIERELDTNDRRRTFVRLTRKTHTMFAKLERRPQDRMFTAISNLSMADRRRIHAALGDLMEAVRPGPDEQA